MYLVPAADSIACTASGVSPTGLAQEDFFLLFAYSIACTASGAVSSALVPRPFMHDFAVCLD